MKDYRVTMSCTYSFYVRADNKEDAIIEAVSNAHDNEAGHFVDHDASDALVEEWD